MYDYEKLKNTLQTLSEEKHRDFHRKLVPNIKDNLIILGIPVPRLRKLAKEILSECDNIDDYFACVGHTFYEEIMLQGIVIGYLSCDHRKKLHYISAFVPNISDWAVCDTFCSSIRIPKTEKQSFYEYLSPYLYGENEFAVRFGVVMLLQNYVCDEFIVRTLDTLKNIRNNQYYVQMALAGAWSVCYIQYPEQTLSVFAEKSLDRFVQNKAIQKCRESLRITDNDKKRLLSYKIK